jgi:hypothetical protein
MHLFQRLKFHSYHEVIASIIKAKTSLSISYINQPSILKFFATIWLSLTSFFMLFYFPTPLKKKMYQGLSSFKSYN